MVLRQLPDYRLCISVGDSKSRPFTLDVRADAKIFAVSGSFCNAMRILWRMESLPDDMGQGVWQKSQWRCRGDNEMDLKGLPTNLRANTKIIHIPIFGVNCFRVFDSLILRVPSIPLDHSLLQYLV